MPLGVRAQIRLRTSTLSPEFNPVLGRSSPDLMDNARVGWVQEGDLR